MGVRPAIDVLARLSAADYARPGVGEDEFARDVIALAHLCRWKVIHVRPARTLKGWRTPIQGDGKGYLDTLFVKDRVFWAELKVRPNKLTPEQVQWAEWLLDAGQEVWCFYPEDWDAIKACLGYRGVT